MPTAITKCSAYFNPDEFPFEVFGFLEEYSCADTFAYLGNKRIDEPTQSLGTPGSAVRELVGELQLSKGLKLNTVKASPQRPRRVIVTQQAICGRVKRKN